MTRKDLAQEQYDTEAWGMVFRYEEPWLKLAVEMGWLQSIKSALHLHGLFSNNNLYPLCRWHTEAERQKIRQCLENAFGPIKKVGQ